MNQEHEIVLYQIEDTNICVNVIFKYETFWMTQKAMAELFDVNVPAISKHLSNIFEDEELIKESTVSKMEIVQKEGNRNVKREQEFYNLDAIIAVGYRVNSKKATRFRQWATKTLKEYITKGFVLNDDMLKMASLSEKIILMNCWSVFAKLERVSEGLIKKKLQMFLNNAVMIMIRTVKSQRIFYAFVQNKLHFAVTGKTAAEFIYERADSDKPAMGLTTWKEAPNGKVLKRDIGIAKNYLNEKELSRLNRLVTMFIDYAELMAEDEILMSMQDWVEQTNQFLMNNRRKVLAGKKKVSHDVAIEKANKEYEVFRVKAGPGICF